MQPVPGLSTWMICPVCGANLELFAEECTQCRHSWNMGQAICPATLNLPGQPQCQLPFRHNERKHRLVGYQLADGEELTILWDYPANTHYRVRSEDYQKAVRNRQ